MAADLASIDARLERIERMLIILVECMTESDEEEEEPASLDG